MPAIQVNIPVNPAFFLAGTDALVIATLALFESELAAGAAVPVPGIKFQSAYGFGYLKKRSLSPVAVAYMAEIRAVEAEFIEREKRLSAIYG